MTTTTKGTAKVTLPSDTEILITREFAAPRHLVFRALTSPELVSRWWHAGHGVMKSCEIDLREGGTWRYAMTAHGGFEVAFHGEYREIVPDERIVSIEEYEGAPGAVAVTTTSLTEGSGRTTVSILSRHLSQADRDAVLESGMESGMQAAMDLLEEVASGFA
ncbi:MAG TPA: SRPBCC family protein [Candidatus Dormibacteraeota bacterium]|nr:SRPBCC family protein [Candidatus Dormibacteraeota bacterium]